MELLRLPAVTARKSHSHLDYGGQRAGEDNLTPFPASPFPKVILSKRPFRLFRMKYKAVVARRCSSTRLHMTRIICRRVLEQRRSDWHYTLSISQYRERSL
ncbi:hypothetical protein Krac_11215 [Ktedonobacter racemifer DSM 44963]|uniref:Uncharacterized protein n=1 Tax=Ktedonobacter racemifer DSM 44963 TaxID=485913 RepID=D6TJP3_KTERA|nr:hypothetical protein Krac_11215 [Ktedonobacter racemifer DSM 44963]